MKGCLFLGGRAAETLLLVFWPYPARFVVSKTLGQSTPATRHSKCCCTLSNMISGKKSQVRAPRALFESCSGTHVCVRFFGALDATVRFGGTTRDMRFLRQWP